MKGNRSAGARDSGAVGGNAAPGARDSAAGNGNDAHSATAPPAPPVGTPRDQVPLAYVLKMFPRTSETFVLNELLELERRGQRLVIYSLKQPLPGPRHAILSRLNAEVIYVPESPWRAAGPVTAAQARLFARDPVRYARTLWYVVTRRNWSAMKRFLQSGVLVLHAESRGVRHLHAHFATSATRVAMLASRLSPGLGYSFTAHAKDIYLDGQDVDLLRDKILEARFVITVSDYNHRHLEQLCGPEVAGRITRLYNGVDTEQFSGAGAESVTATAAIASSSAESAATAVGPVILCVARLVEKKGVGDLLRAIAVLKQKGLSFTCRIVGDGPLRGDLERLARDLDVDDRVFFLGATSHEMVAAELARARLLALPCLVASDGNRDGLPTVILEAMAAGLPVVSTRLTGIPEMVEDGVTGLLVPPGQPIEIAPALESLLQDESLCTSMGGAGRRLVQERFNLTKNVAILHERFVRELKTAEAAGTVTRMHPTGLRRLWPFFAPYVRDERRDLLLAGLASLGLAISEILAPWPLKLVFDYALRLHPHAGHISFMAPLAAWSPDRILLLASSLLIGMALVRAACGYGQTFFLSRSGQRIVTSLRERTFNHMQRLSLAFHRGSRAGDLLVRLTGDINVLSDVLVTATVAASGQMLQLAGMIAVMCWMDLPLTAAALSVLPLMAFVVARYTRQIREAARTQRKREGAIASRAGEAIAQIAVVKAFTGEEEESRRFVSESRAVLSAGVRAGRIEAAMQRGVEMLVAVGTGAVLWIGAHRVFTRTLSPGDLLVFAAYLRQMYRPIRQTASLINRTSKAQACAERIADILESEPEMFEMPGAVPAPRFKGAIRFDNVGFAYRSGSWALHDISFSVPPGSRVAIVGPTGSGKSTLVGLLPRFHDPLEGCVRVDNRDVRDFTLRSLREQISLVLQEPMLFGGTIRENIAYGRRDATEGEIVAAARAAAIHEYILTLPEGYETRIGERGATVSGGQKQRLSVARAILRDAPLLILDEPTTGLDSESEAAVHLALERLMKGRTTLLITHRLASVATADLIVVLEDGQLAGIGTHGRLLSECPLYRRLVDQERTTQESLVG